MWFSCWQVYYVYGFMLLVFVILIIVTICVTIVGTYFLLNAENYHWQWTSFFSAASTALYVYFYSIYYYHVKTKMSGFFQTSFYFGYTLMFCLGLGILCGKFVPLSLLCPLCNVQKRPSLRNWKITFIIEFQVPLDIWAPTCSSGEFTGTSNVTNSRIYRVCWFDCCMIKLTRIGR